MKQIIKGCNKYYIDNEGYKYSIELRYWIYNKLACQINWKGNKRYGLTTHYSPFGKVIEQRYHL